MWNAPKVGYLVGFMVLKNLPDYDAVLVRLIHSELLAVLPRKWMIRNYRQGETGWASIVEIKGPRITLSQRNPVYVRKMIEYLFSDVLVKNSMKVKRVAGISGSNLYKVAIDPGSVPVETSDDLFDFLKPHFNGFEPSTYFGEGTRMYFVRFDPDPERYVLNALCPPGRRELVLKVIYLEEMRKVRLLVDAQNAGLFIGRKGENLITAMKLTDLEIEVKGVSMDVYQEFRKSFPETALNFTGLSRLNSMDGGEE